MIQIRSADAVLNVEHPAAIDIQHGGRFWGVTIGVITSIRYADAENEESRVIRLGPASTTLFLNSRKLQVETHAL